MNTLQAGFARLNATPPLGMGLVGYYHARYGEAVLDELEVNALAVACGDSKAVILTLDHEGIPTDVADTFREYVSQESGIPMDHIFLHSTHIHTGPFFALSPETRDCPFEMDEREDQLEAFYYEMVRQRLADAANLALKDLKPARMGWGEGMAPGISFVRRFRMKDGTTQTHVRPHDPNLEGPIGTPDERVGVLRFDREGAETILLGNFGCHPDVVGEHKYSADWPGFFRRITENCLDNVKAIFINGAQGDVNHNNPYPVEGVRPFKGYAHARHMGRTVAGAVLQVFDRVKYVDVDYVAAMQRRVHVPSNMPKPEDIPEAYRVRDLTLAGKTEEAKASRLTYPEACRMLALEHGPEFIEMDVIGLAIGPVALFGMPGEPFTGIGRAMKDTEDWELVMPGCMTNGKYGYFPMKDAFEGDGYEVRSSRFKGGVAELIIQEGKALLDELKPKTER